MTDPDDLAHRLENRLKQLEGHLDRSISELKRHVDQVGDVIYQQTEALLGLYRELDGKVAIPPLRRWAVSPDAARIIGALIVARQPGLVVELGSGSSTVLLAQLLERNGHGRLVSFEHDPMYFAETEHLLDEFGVTNVDLRYAPLVPQQIGSDTYDWYDMKDTSDIRDVDMVFVDGPPEQTGHQARFPAVPMLIDRCADRCTFVLDDYRRVDEQQIVERWSTEYGATLTRSISIVEKWLAVVELSSTATGRYKNA